MVAYMYVFNYFLHNHTNIFSQGTRKYHNFLEYRNETSRIETEKAPKCYESSVIIYLLSVFDFFNVYFPSSIFNIGPTYLYIGQEWRIKGFEGPRAPPEHTSAPSYRHKHLFQIKEKNPKTL